MLKDSYEFSLIQAYADFGIVIDTNLLILDFVGEYNTAKISTFKRTVTYTINDFLLLRKLMSSFRKVIINQPILTEAFNLIDSLNNLENYSLNRYLRNRILKFADFTSSHKDVLGMKSFDKFGFADASIDLLSSSHLILTDDLRLYGYLSSQGKPTINFNHIREFN